MKRYNSPSPLPSLPLPPPPPLPSPLYPHSTEYILTPLIIQSNIPSSISWMQKKSTGLENSNSSLDTSAHFLIRLKDMKQRDTETLISAALLPHFLNLM